MLSVSVYGVPLWYWSTPLTIMPLVFGTRSDPSIDRMCGRSLVVTLSPCSRFSWSSTCVVMSSMLPAEAVLPKLCEYVYEPRKL